MDCFARKGILIGDFARTVPNVSCMQHEASTVICSLAVCRCTTSVHILGSILEEWTG